jgi:hypothetical protein
VAESAKSRAALWLPRGFPGASPFPCRLTLPPRRFTKTNGLSWLPPRRFAFFGRSFFDPPNLARKKPDLFAQA